MVDKHTYGSTLLHFCLLRVVRASNLKAGKYQLHIIQVEVVLAIIITIAHVLRVNYYAAT